jgi:hypothetical protein
MLRFLGMIILVYISQEQASAINLFNRQQYIRGVGVIIFL